MKAGSNTSLPLSKTDMAAKTDAGRAGSVPAAAPMPSDARDSYDRDQHRT